MDAELRAFEEAERKRLGLGGPSDQWTDEMLKLTFTKKERAHVTLLVGGLTRRRTTSSRPASGASATRSMTSTWPTTTASSRQGVRQPRPVQPDLLHRGQPREDLSTLRDKHGMSAKHIVDKYVFLTAGACGPCRFGMYVTEYRKALRDAGFDGFRVVLFQQTGGL